MRATFGDAWRRARRVRTIDNLLTVKSDHAFRVRWAEQLERQR